MTHLAYTDDVVIFTSGSKRSLKLVVHQLQNYEKYFGQLINIDKSCFLISSKASSADIQIIKEATGFRHADFPIIYLGCPLYVGRWRISYYSDMVSKIMSKITGW